MPLTGSSVRPSKFARKKVEKVETNIVLCVKKIRQLVYKQKAFRAFEANTDFILKNRKVQCD